MPYALTLAEPHAPFDFQSYRRQETVFAALSLVLLAFLFVAQLLWKQYLGSPDMQVLVTLSAGIGANSLELFWLRRRRDLDAAGMARLTWTMIAVNLAIAFGLATYSYKPDVQFFALMIPPILQAAFRFSLAATFLTVGISDCLIFFWVWNYFRLHPPVNPNEYVEAGTIALIFAVMGLLATTLVHQLRRKQIELAASMIELEKTQARLRVEEKLAAVGRLSSAIAHEIRNPVAMISSALSTARNYGPEAVERHDMYDIATKESARLERLTSDFLAYARPRQPAKILSNVADSIGYIAEVCRPRAAGNDIEIISEYEEQLWAQIDDGQLQQALLNLVVNAMEASTPQSAVTMRGYRKSDQVCIEIENGDGPIPGETVACIFEPFFTTKASGTGLGLAISRNIALAMGGDLALARNDERIRFVLSLPSSGTPRGAHEQDSHRR